MIQTSGSRLTKTVETALLDQITREFGVAHVYLSANYYYLSRQFSGIASHFFKEYQSELKHGNDIANHLDTLGCDLTTHIFKCQQNALTGDLLSKIESWESLLDPFETAFNAEKQNTVDINKTMQICLSENDHITYSFLSKIASEQMNCLSESETNYIKAKSYSGFDGLFWHLNKELH
mmetsp:Transcript_71523/g.87731  ORF Transcript_71523/g.87731 Transcript_71523/m.87731 type:complete len:178 (-) Transcript_71523:1735-2268(-)